jgi:HJR/Mrr/RecB family endonuclease
LSEILSESDIRHRFVLQALNALHELFINGANDFSRYLDDGVDEAFEVTRVCKGRFRKLASSSMDMLRMMPPTDFEAMCAELIAQFGLTDVTLTPIVADDGIDVVAFQVLEGKRIKYIIQCKRNSIKNKVDVRVVRELAGVKMDARADRALVVTTSEFTKPAKDFARRTRARAWGIRLIDHKLLKRLLACTD